MHSVGTVHWMWGPIGTMDSTIALRATTERIFDRAAVAADAALAGAAASSSPPSADAPSADAPPAAEEEASLISLHARSISASETTQWEASRERAPSATPASTSRQSFEVTCGQIGTDGNGL